MRLALCATIHFAAGQPEGTTLGACCAHDSAACNLWLQSKMSQPDSGLTHLFAFVIRLWRFNCCAISLGSAGRLPKASVLIWFRSYRRYNLAKDSLEPAGAWVIRFCGIRDMLVRFYKQLRVGLENSGSTIAPGG